MMKMAVGSDHGGFEVKEAVKAALVARGLDVVDVGCPDRSAADYPDYAREVARRVAHEEADQGVLVCTTGLGMTMAANKFPGVRAALCLSPDMAAHARLHNNANVLTLAAKYTKPAEAVAILEAWFANAWAGEERHERRVGKLESYGADAAEAEAVWREDPETYAAIREEAARENRTINLIASENYASRAVREAQGSVMTNKYAEGYPGKRWYFGCEAVDKVERLAIERACALFKADHANVQPHCGSAANMAVYFAALKPGDTVLAMSLAHGGHLTHGHDVNFSGRLFHFVPYGVSRKDERLDLDEVAALALQHKPRLIVVGASAYSRTLDFAGFREIADRVGAMLMVDMAHIAGLVAGGAHPSPVPHADFVTTTTHKTLRGPRSGLVLCRARYAADIDRQVFPGLQGGPLMHTVAAKAVCFHEAMRPEFAAYAAQIVCNAAALAGALARSGFRLVSGGTDNHMMLVDVLARGITGKDAADALELAGIVVNKNAIPFDTKSPFVTSGIRLGTPSVTTRGMKEPEMETIAALIAGALAHVGDAVALADIRRQAEALTVRFPLA